MRRPAELVGLGSLLVFYGFVHMLGVAELYSAMNIVGPIVLCAILGWSAFRIVEGNPIAVWAPLFWFRIACATYYGFGALVPHIVDEETLQRIFSLYHFDDALNLKINLIYCFGIFCTLLFSWLFLGGNKVGERREEAGGGRLQADRTLLFALFFLFVGGGLRYGVILPYAFGLIDFTLPGAVGALSKVYYVGIFLFIVHGTDHSRKVLFWVSVLVAIEIAVSVASFAKMDLLLILIFSFLGLINRHVTKTRVFVGASCILFVYFASQPLVGFGRTELALRYGGVSGVGLIERWEIVQDYFDEGHGVVPSTLQGGLSRLSYVNVAAFAVDRYDAGVPGSTFENAGAVFIPRLLWSGKPIITQTGTDLYFHVRGRYGSALGVGHFAEAYWNFGWTGIVPFMAVLALILSIFSRVSMTIVARKDWFLLPVVILGVNMGLRVDGHFVSDILGPAWIAIVFGAGLWMAKFFALSYARSMARSSGFAGNVHGS